MIVGGRAFFKRAKCRPVCAFDGDFLENFLSATRENPAANAYNEAHIAAFPGGLQVRITGQATRWNLTEP
jgi:hypothetical protein